MRSDPFTVNKQKVREMDLRLIERHLGDRKGHLRYLGLPASDMKDILLWRPHFSHYTVVERGRPGEEFGYQHDLILRAMQLGLASQLHLLRGDMDDILLNGCDAWGNQLVYPFDLVSLDYCGGLVYKDVQGRARRVDSMGSLLRHQAMTESDFLLLVSCNMDNEDQGEIRRVLRAVAEDFSKLGVDATRVIEAYLKHELEEARLKVYVPHLIESLAARWYQTRHFKPIYYEGNRGTRMMHFSAWLKRTSGYVGGKPRHYNLVRILDLPAFHCTDGDLSETDFGIPKLALQY